MSNLLEDAKRTVKPAIERKDFRVFAFGPSLLEAHTVDQPTTPICGHEDVEVHAKYLRYVTRLELEKLGFPVDYGESPDVLQF